MFVNRAIQFVFRPRLWGDVDKDVGLHGSLQCRLQCIMKQREEHEWLDSYDLVDVTTDRWHRLSLGLLEDDGVG